ncbi:MAG: acyl carrier protein [Candidatus Aenigmatarchaeota archaeon]|nr:MAG: acyl carrier protein [Candidatus Aenigmarchaeota archaeon]
MGLSRKEIEERVKRIIAEKYGVDPSELKPETRFIEDLGADSLSTIELIAELEEEFDIEIPDEDAEKNQTVGQAVEYMIRRLTSR